MLDMAGVDDPWLLHQPEGRHRGRHLFLPARRGDRPVDPAGVQRFDQFADPGERPRRLVESLVPLARIAVDPVGCVVVEGDAGKRRDLPGEPSPVHPDQGSQSLAGRREACRLERLEPGLDPRLYRVDERPIEVEQHGARSREISHGHARKATG
jgi:hypothetical protein